MKAMRLKPGHDEIFPDELSHDELRACLVEAAVRGMSVPLVEVEAAYEVLLEGRSDLAGALLGRALFPAGADSIKARVDAHRRQVVRSVP